MSTVALADEVPDAVAVSPEVYKVSAENGSLRAAAARLPSGRGGRPAFAVQDRCVMTAPNTRSERSTVAGAEAAPGDRRPRRPPSTRAVLLGAAAVVLLVVVSFLAGHYFEVDGALWSERIEGEIESWGSLGVLASIGLMVVHSFVPFPAEFIAVANGMLFGAAGGVAVTWTGAMLGAFAAFGLARLLGRPFVEKMVRAKDRQRIDQWIAGHGWQVLLISRFIPVIAFNLINYAAGLTRVSWFTFAWTTGVGILPATILMVLLGHNIELMTWEAWLLLVACGIVLWLVIRRSYSRYEVSISEGDEE